mmetsp:Transcript_7108/g.11990  ORF Transcript_7108/g.11990 Transcript_7108/m.11990 type:complete len:194 (-) Transcript_7108:633-1214(-)
MPPDEENYANHGIKNLVLKYSEFGTLIQIDDTLHKESVFYKKNMLDGVLKDFVDRLNLHLEPLKEESQSIDRFSMLFLLIGFVATTLLATLIGYLYSLWISLGLVVFYVVTLGLIFYRNYRQLQFLQQSILLNMAIIVYLENQTSLLQRGVRAQMGFMGNWIELNKHRQVNISQLNRAQPDNQLPEATFKRTL